VSKTCAKILASEVRTKADELSGICFTQIYIRRSFTICASRWIFEMTMLERVACMKRMIHTHNTVDSKDKSTWKIQRQATTERLKIKRVSECRRDSTECQVANIRQRGKLQIQ